MEILFRGKRIDHDEWVYGGVYTEGDTPFILGLFSSYPVIPETVGRYTGMEDKNGKKIFDGDICKMHYFFENYDGFGAFEDEAEITCRIAITPFGLGFEGEGMSGYLHEYVEEPVE